MGATLSVIKTLVIPAIIALLAFLVISYLLVPLWRRYRARYRHYLPVDDVSPPALARRILPAEWWDRPGAAPGGSAWGLWSLASPPSVLPRGWWRVWEWRGRAAGESPGGGGGGRFGLGDDDDDDDDEVDVGELGEELGSLGAERRELVEREARRADRAPGDVERRLSRDLEEGFRDDSDSDGGELEPVVRPR